MMPHADPDRPLQSHDPAAVHLQNPLMQGVWHRPPTAPQPLARFAGHVGTPVSPAPPGPEPSAAASPPFLLSESPTRRSRTHAESNIARTDKHKNTLMDRLLASHDVFRTRVRESWFGCCRDS